MRALAAQGARLALPAIIARGQSLRISCLASRRQADARDRSAFSSRRPPPPKSCPTSCWCRWRRSTALGHRIGYGAGHYDHTLAHLRKVESHRGHRPCLRGAGNRGRAGAAARRGAGLCANGSTDVRFPEFDDLRILFVGDVVGRAGRTAVSRTSARHDPRLGARSRHRQWRERRRRLRHHRGDLPGIHRRRRRRRHARQSCLGSARGAGVHRARAAAGSPGEFSAGHAGPRLCAGRHQERQARAGHQRHRPRLHDAVRRSVRRHQPRTRSLSAARGGRRHRGRFPLRGLQRKAGHRLFLRRPRQSRRRHPHPCADSRTTRSFPAAPPT